MTHLIFACLWFALMGQAPQPFRPVDFAPDGEHLVLMHESVLSIMSPSDHTPHSIPDSQGGYAPRYSPDGKYIVFGADNNGVAVVKLYNVARDQTRQIIDKGLPPFEWRGDSDVFVATRKGDDGKLMLLRYHPTVSDLSGTDPLPVTRIGEHRFVWLANTDDVAFIGEDDNVYLDEAGQSVRLTSTGDVTGLALSTDGKHLNWTVRNPNARAQLLTLYTMLITSRTVTKLAFPAQPLGRLQRQVKAVEQVVFSPDHEHFAMLVTFAERTAAKPGAQETLQAIYTSRLDGREFRRVAQDRYAGDPKIRAMIWSRGGQLLAIATREGAELSVYDIKQHTSPRRIALQ